MSKLKEFWKSNTNNLVSFTFVVITLLWVTLQFYFALKFKLQRIELIEIGIFSFLVMILGLIDIKTKRIPLWLTGPMIVVALLWHFFDLSGMNGVLGLGIDPLESAMGVAFGFVMADLITHFGNWLAKFPKSTQGLLPLWMALPLMLAFCFVPIIPLWGVFAALIIFRGIIELVHRRNEVFRKVIDWLLSQPLIAYLLLFGLLMTFAFVSVNNLDYFKQAGARTELLIFTLCGAYVLEEVIIPVIYKFCKVSSSEEDDKPSVFGGGDALFVAALGGLWGPREVNACLVLAFFLALIIMGSIKLIHFIKKQTNQSALQEVAFAPFIIFSAQLILFLEIMHRMP